MTNMTLANIAAACGGIYHGEESAKTKEVTSITTDSRKAEEGCLFIAIKGERSDGHDYIRQVYDKGALCVLSEHELESCLQPYIQVDSSLEAIKKIAEFYRSQLSITVIGITGSVGKTSTKEMVAGVLSEKFQTLKTLGNFNNELGLPLTIFRLTDDDEVAVLEMGISDFGEMHRLSKIAKPDICMITNIGTCHLENLGDRSGVLRAKTEIFDYMNENGSVLLNGDDDQLQKVRSVYGKCITTFGLNEHCNIYADRIEPMGLSGTKCVIHTPQGNFTTIIPIPGDYMVRNALAATAAGLEMGMELYEIKAGIEKAEALAGRNKVIRTTNFAIIDGCYNANPMSMKASVDLLCLAEGKKVAILGDMGELGEKEKSLHYEVGEYVGRSAVDILLCVGELSKEMERGFHTVRPDAYCMHYDTVDDFIAKIPDELCFGDSILIKASHFMKFERILDALKM